ncbi:MAG: hypothetical protein HWD61_15900 [Parachlamydiaceae bacterium]|nr:MAG: hypothetical protein HWD61_15900 [Parachlamydiaceae bacterium]
MNERPRNETRGRRPEPINSKVHFLTDPENENQATLSPSFSIVDDHHVIMIEKQPIALQFLGKGNFHKVWRGIEDKSHLVIKLWLGGLDPKTKEESYKDTLQAYQLLNQQADQYKDFRVSRLINRETIRRDGFYVYEYIQGEKPKFNDVKGLFQK